MSHLLIFMKWCLFSDEIYIILFMWKIVTNMIYNIVTDHENLLNVCLYINIVTTYLHSFLKFSVCHTRKDQIDWLN